MVRKIYEILLEDIEEREIEEFAKYFREVMPKEIDIFEVKQIVRHIEFQEDLGIEHKKIQDE